MTSQTIKTTLAIGHLLLVACGAFSVVRPGTDTPIQRAFGRYGSYTGANSAYGFFAPSVASSWRARFSLYDEAGNGWVEDTPDGPNREVALRISCILGMFARDNLREGLAVCWAARMFARHPSARLVNVHVEHYDVPSLAEYRSGDRPAWVTSAAYSFAHGLDKEE
jgi:hypothetical protein